ncbi:MAG: peptidoglycan DD-metalloendopeptidase family protein [Saprospiraceae bacterium]|nr:peptidoglycan DD-metalloendopeptidase family protein [Saprospiraceae bacterium]MDW8484765.1 peptidoglycan DD-metalloendopeptidase family protein [Saprospiraceae bacterium]
MFLLDVTVLGVVVGLFLFRVPLEKWGESAELTEQPTFAQEEKGRWNFPLRQLRLEEYSLKRGDALATILQQKGFSPQEISLIVESARGVFSMHSLRTGKPLYLIYRKRRDNGKPLYAVYEPSPYEYIVFHLYDQPCVEVIKRDIKVETRVAAGEVQSNLWHALVESGLKDDLADAMIDALAVSVDFYRQKIGDRFKVLYEQDMVEGQPVGSGKILVAVYEREGKSYYAFRFSPSEGKTEYYDYDGRPARKAFLKAPVKYSRISSRFSMNRLHPILGYRRPHFGTDYAAPYGTPILAVADGVVTEATQRGGNGKYVRIRHDKVYETQYLHMSSFARGIRPGVRVVQGQVIGYVGATGLATGPHVCFRFWKNGQQVDHLRLNLPQPEPISGQLWEAFKARRDSLLEQLKRIEYPRTSAEKKPNTAP